MKVEVINTGTELLLGEILNTNFQYLSRRLNQLGFDVLYQTTVGDNAGTSLALMYCTRRRSAIMPGA